MVYEQQDNRMCKMLQGDYPKHFNFAVSDVTHMHPDVNVNQVKNPTALADMALPCQMWKVLPTIRGYVTSECSTDGETLQALFGDSNPFLRG